MRIGITGAAGFIAKALAVRAHMAGHQVRGLDLSPAGEGFFRDLRGEYRVGDITDAAAARGFAQGLDRIYHTAAVVKESGPWALFERVNVGGTQAVLAAARAAGVREFVHFSTVMVYGFAYPDGVDETAPLDGAGNPYCTTKIQAEQAALAAHASGRFEVYVIRPGDVYGPGSVPWTLRPVEMMKARRWVYVDSRKHLHNHVYVDNLVDGVELVVAARQAGTPFVITDDQRTTVREFFGHYQKWLGVGWLPEVPAALAFPAARAADRLQRLTGGDWGLSEQTVRYLCRPGAYSAEKIKQLGYKPAVSLFEGMARAKQWLKRENVL
jgi:nucleoside-diphosphate-sugar epimerase